MVHTPLDNSRTLLSRRGFLAGLAATASSVVIGCGDGGTEPVAEPSRLRIVATKPTKPTKFGLQPLGLTPPLPALQRDGLLYVPASYKPSEPLPLVILLHGSSGAGADWFGSFVDRAEAARVVMLAPDSRTYTWDILDDGFFSQDVEFINTALAVAFDRVAIDAARIALFGFSDGASYALSLGLANGDAAKHVVACSPGTIVAAPAHGKPEFFIAHGTSDPVLPIDFTSRRIVPQLKVSGYTVTYTEFDGGHELPPAIADAAMAWLAAAFR
jgi:phospholipase/carboxylesterase